MRPAATVVCAIVAGTAVKLLLSALPRRRRRRVIQRCVNSSISIQTASSSSSSYSSSHAEILELLNYRVPLKTTTTTSECTFCLEMVRSRQTARTTSCGHTFHPVCLEKWVLYTADAALNWRAYSLSDDGSLSCNTRSPSCPNCSADLHVLPPSLVRAAMLAAIARTLSLPNLAIAAEMYDAGLVHPVMNNDDNREQNTSVRSSSTSNVQSDSIARYVRTDSTLSEPSSLLIHQLRDPSTLGPRRSFPGPPTRNRMTPFRTRAEQRGWRRNDTETESLSEQYAPVGFELQALS